MYDRLELEHESHFDTTSHVFIFAKSVSVVILQSLLSQTTQLEPHSTSVFAIKTNHQFGVEFLVATKYKYSPLDVAFQSHEFLFVERGSIHGRCQLYDCDTTIAVSI